MAELWAALFLMLTIGSLALHIFSLPANWVILGLTVFWKFMHPETWQGWNFILVLTAIAASGEILEFILQAAGAKKYGSTKKGNIGGIIGAILGAIFGAPFFFGLGALVGALCGAFLGCLALELGQGRPMHEAKQAAWGAMWGKFFGLSVKFGLGITMLALLIPRVWPS